MSSQSLPLLVSAGSGQVVHLRLGGRLTFRPGGVFDPNLMIIDQTGLCRPLQDSTVYKVPSDPQRRRLDEAARENIVNAGG